MSDLAWYSIRMFTYGFGFAIGVHMVLTGQFPFIRRPK